MNKTLEQLISKLQHLQIEQDQVIRDIKKLTEGSQAPKKSSSSDKTNHEGISVGDWVQITNSYRGEKGLVGQVTKTTNKTVTLITTQGVRSKRTRNVVKTDPPQDLK